MGSVGSVTIVERGGYEAIRRAIGRKNADRISFQYRDRVQPLVETATYGLEPRGRKSKQRLASMKGTYTGKRCFIIGNGPSLRQTDLSSFAANTPSG